MNDHVYAPDPKPANKRDHNRLMNEAVIKFRVPLTMVCPDCYLPPRMCRHTQEPGLDGLYRR